MPKKLLRAARLVVLAYIALDWLPPNVVIFGGTILCLYAFLDITRRLRLLYEALQARLLTAVAVAMARIAGAWQAARRDDGWHRGR